MSRSTRVKKKAGSPSPTSMEVMKNALGAVDDDDMLKMNSIMSATVDEAKSTASPPSPDPPPPPPPLKDKAAEFLALLEKLSGLVTDAEQQVRPVFKFAYAFMEVSVMKYFAQNPRITAMRRVWPVECAKIDNNLQFVKTQMEAVDKKFKDSMDFYCKAVDKDENAWDSLTALEMYEAKNSILMPMLDDLRKRIIEAKHISDTLMPKVNEMMQESETKGITGAGLVPAVAVAAAAYKFPETRTRVFLGVGAAAVSACIVGMSILHRRELRNDVEYLSAQIRLIMDIEQMKGQLDSGQAFLSKLTNK